MTKYVRLTISIPLYVGTVVAGVVGTEWCTTPTPFVFISDAICESRKFLMLQMYSTEVDYRSYTFIFTIDVFVFIMYIILCLYICRYFNSMPALTHLLHDSPTAQM